MKEYFIIILSVLIAIIVINTGQEPLQSQQFAIYHSKKPALINSVIRVVTAYNAGDVNQCWGDPCISANGENICELIADKEKVCAANFVPFNTILDIENYGQCRVVDRTNSKYKNRVDIAMPKNELQRALTFGKQKLKVSIIK